MEIVYSPQAVEDLKYWKKAGNNSILDYGYSILYAPKSGF